MLRLISHSVDNSRLTRDHLFLQHPEPVLLKSSSSPPSSLLPSAKVAGNPFVTGGSSVGNTTPKPWISAGPSVGAATHPERVSPTPASSNPFRRNTPSVSGQLPASPPQSIAPLSPNHFTQKKIIDELDPTQNASSPPLPPRPSLRPSERKPEPGWPVATPSLPTNQRTSFWRDAPAGGGTSECPGDRARLSTSPSAAAIYASLPTTVVAVSPTRARPPTPQRKPGSLTASSHLGLDPNASLRPPSSERTSLASGAGDAKNDGGLTGRRSRGNSSASATASSWTLELVAPSSSAMQKHPSTFRQRVSQQASVPPPQSTSHPTSRFKGFSAGSVELPLPPSPAASSTIIAPSHTGETPVQQQSKALGVRPPPPPKRRLSAQVSPVSPTSSPFADHLPSSSHSRATSLTHTSSLYSHASPSISAPIAALGGSIVSKARDEVSRRTSSLRSAPSAMYDSGGTVRARKRTEEELEREKERKEEWLGLISAAAAEETSSEQDDLDADAGDPFSGAAASRRRRADSSTSESDGAADHAEEAGEGVLGGFEEKEDLEQKRDERRRKSERRNEVEREARRREEKGQWERLS
ncbi:hypothetical protein JCM11251_001558 [Rhodosporidiobolus azoricus]